MKRLLAFCLALAVLSGSAVALAEDVPAAPAAETAETSGIAPEKAEKPAKKAKKARKKAKKSKKSAKKAQKEAEKAEKAPEEAPEAEKSAENSEKSAETAAETAKSGPFKAGPFAAEALASPFASRAALEKLVRRDGVLLDSYAAVVGTNVVTVGEVLNLCQTRLQRIAASGVGRAEAARRAQEAFDEARDSLVADELVLLAFAEAGGTLPGRAIEDHIAEVLNTRFGGDREKLFSALAEARLSMDEWRKKMTDQLAIQVMRQKEISSRVLVTPGDVRAAYDADKTAYAHPERVHIRMLSIPRGTTGEEVASSRLLARRIRERILSGVADFPRAARLLSHATGAAENSGDAGWHDVGDLLPGISEAVQKLSVGEISPVLEVPPFLYLVQLEAREEASVEDFSAVADDIESALRAAQYEKLEKAWLDTLKGKYFVQTYRHELF